MESPVCVSLNPGPDKALLNSTFPITSNDLFGADVLIPTRCPFTTVNTKLLSSYALNIFSEPYCLTNNAGPGVELTISIFSDWYVVVFKVVVVPWTVKFDQIIKSPTISVFPITSNAFFGVIVFIPTLPPCSNVIPCSFDPYSCTTFS